jgi:hypothetical protein
MRFPMGADYILDNCLDEDEEDRSSFEDWFEQMKHASTRAAEI